ncbi:MAG: glutamate--tRNA ligase family protein [Planctomycetota bacterium]
MTAESQRVVRTRLAPTPSGYLHFGNACSFVLTWLTARAARGKVMLRIDDLDAARKRPEYIADVFESLDWLGLDYDEGPTGPDDFERNYSQHLRLDLYAEALDQLRKNGLMFPCDCSRATIRESANGLHPASCATNTEERDFDQPNIAWRISTELANMVEWSDADGQPRSVNLHDAMRDFVVRRKDRIPSYQIASLVDDREYGINTIVRGSDLLESTAAQRWLAEKLKQNEFLSVDFIHHDLVLDKDQQKLSKSDGSTSLRALRANPDNRAGVFEKISQWLKLPAKAGSARELLDVWSAN